MPFDRIISVEMLEHVRNYDALFGRIRQWLRMTENSLYIYSVIGISSTLLRQKGSITGWGVISLPVG